MKLLFWVTVVISGFVFLNCKPDLDLPPLVAEGERVQIGTEMDIEICSGTLAMLDNHVTTVEKFLDIPRRKGKIPIYIFDVPEEVEDRCPLDGACYIPPQRGGPASIVHASNFTAAFHEVIHDVASHSKFNHPPHFLAEGLATSLGSDGCGLTGDHSLDELLEIFNGEEFDYFSHQAMQIARFFRYLMATYGPNSLVDWASQLHWSDSPKKIRREFKSHYDSSLNSAWQAHDTGEPYPPPYRCLVEEIPWQGTVWEHTFRADCDDAFVQTVFTDANQVVAEAVVNLPKERDYFIEYSGPDGEFVAFAACDTCGSNSFLVELNGIMTLPAGKHVLRRVAEKHAEPLNVTIRVWPEEPHCDLVVQDCPEGEKCQLLTYWPYWRVDCAPLANLPLGMGDSCERRGLTPDPCGIGTECFELTGKCEPLCPIQGDALPCEAGQTCVKIVESDSHPGFCLESCDPYVNDCGEEKSCFFDYDAFFCIGWEESGSQGDGCLITCEPGFYCGPNESVRSCDSVLGCCTAYCDSALQNPEESCPEQTGGQWCKPLSDTIGYCTIESSQ